MLLHNGRTVSVEAQENGITSNLSGTMEGIVTDANPLYGVYPAENAVSSDSESVTVSVPVVQTAGNKEFDTKAIVSVSRTISNSLDFYAVCGGIKLKFQMSGITKIELESVDGYALSGTTKIRWDEQENLSLIM